MHPFVLFTLIKNKNVNHNQISPNSINTEFLQPFFRIIPMIPFYDSCRPSQSWKAYMLSPFNNTSMNFTHAPPRPPNMSSMIWEMELLWQYLKKWRFPHTLSGCVYEMEFRDRASFLSEGKISHLFVFFPGIQVCVCATAWPECGEKFLQRARATATTQIPGEASTCSLFTNTAVHLFIFYFKDDNPVARPKNQKQFPFPLLDVPWKHPPAASELFLIHKA